MIETKFRGKSIMPIDYLDMIGVEHADGWMVGNLITNGGKPYIVGDLTEATDEYINHEFWAAVEPGSVGQGTGLVDIKGNQIYNSDLIKDDENFVWEVIYSQGAFYARCNDLMARQLLSSINLFGVVVGKKYENPDLIGA
ncbi:YopX family protein [Sporosarcina sp. FSL K6-1508]|uniref:YopX family protein n=1 Tax=Sporosarcina sp. FSL K6-1508 TaxID=2921553 RepID=UPI0030F5D393